MKKKNSDFINSIFYQTIYFVLYQCNYDIYLISSNVRIFQRAIFQNLNL